MGWRSKIVTLFFHITDLSSILCIESRYRPLYIPNNNMLTNNKTHPVFLNFITERIVNEMSKKYGERGTRLAAQMHAQFNDTVVYAGAAPGTHIDFLKGMFTDLHLKYFLIDPGFACVQEHRRPRDCTCIAERFELLGNTESSAEFWHGKNVLFISDIRTSTAGRTPSQTDVQSDMNMQLEWVKKMRPRAGMLKFKLPFANTIVPYIKGDIHLPIWGRQRTAESRLIFTDKTAFDNDTLIEHTYSAGDYEKEMFYFNTTTRMSTYQWPKRGCKCYDCVAESLVLTRYFQALYPQLNVRLTKEVDFLRDRITDNNPSQNPNSCLVICNYSSRSVARKQ